MNDEYRNVIEALKIMIKKDLNFGNIILHEIYIYMEFLLDQKNSELLEQSRDIESAMAFLLFALKKKSKASRNSFIEQAKEKIKPWLGKTHMKWDWLWEDKNE